MEADTLISASDTQGKMATLKITMTTSLPLEDKTAENNWNSNCGRRVQPFSAVSFVADLAFCLQVESVSFLKRKDDCRLSWKECRAVDAARLHHRSGSEARGAARSRLPTQLRHGENDSATWSRQPWDEGQIQKVCGWTADDSSIQHLNGRRERTCSEKTEGI